MLYLNLSLQAWNTPAFNDVLLKEICSLDAATLPLQQGLSSSSYATADKLSAMILNIDNDDCEIIVKAGLFYTGVIAGCSCADDPTPVEENNEYCEVLFRINKRTAETNVSLIS